MSKYDKEREALGLKSVKNIANTEKKKSKYAKEREIILSGRTQMFSKGVTQKREANAKRLEFVERPKNTTVKQDVEKKIGSVYEPIEPSYIDPNKDMFQKIRYNIVKNEAKKTAETASKIVTPSEWNLYKGLFTKGVKMNADEVKKAREIETKIEYAKKNGFEKFYDRFGASYRKGLGLGDDIAEAEKTARPITTGSKVADVGADILGMAASFSRTGGTGLVKPARTIAETLATKFYGGQTASKLGKIVEKATTGGAESIPYSIQQILTDKNLQKNPKKAAEAIVVNLNLGMGTELGIAGIGKLVKSIFPAIKKSIPNMTESDLTNAITNKYKLGKTTGSYKLKKPVVTKQLPSAERLLLPEKATSKIELGAPKPEKPNKSLADAAEKNYNKVADEYNTAIETIQNHFKTNELRTDEIKRVKSELGIDLDDITKRLDDADYYRNNLDEFAKREKTRIAAGVISPEESKYMDELVAYKESQIPRPTVKLEQKLKVPEQYKREMPTRVTSAEIELTKGVQPITKLKAPARSVEAPKATENIQTPKAETKPAEKSYKLKTSQFRTNTLERAKNIPESVKKELKPESFDFVPETKKEWQEKAIQNVAANKQKVINDIKSTETISGGVQAHEAAIVADDLVIQAKKTGNTDELLNFTQDVAAKTREWARGLKGTDTAWDKLSPAGTLIKAQREIMNSVPDELKNAVKTEVKETKTVFEAINKVNKENIDQVFKDLTGEKLKVSKGVREWLEKQESEAMTRVKDYFKPDTSGIIKMRAGIPGEIFTDLAKVGAAKLARKTMDFAEWSVEMIKEFGEKVKPYLQQIFDDSNKLIKSKSLRTAEQKAVTSIDNVVKKTLSENGIKIQDIARKHVSEIDETGQTLAQKLTEQANLSPEVAAKVEKLFAERLKALTTAKKQQILDQMFKPKKTYQKKSLGDKIIEFSNMGAIGDSKYTKILNEKYNIPELDAETAKKIIKQAEYIQKVTNVLEKERLTNKMMNEIRKQIPADLTSKLKGATFVNTLLNPKTILSKNIPGNISQTIAMRFNKYLMTPIDVLRSGITGTERKVTFRTNRGFMDNVKAFADYGIEGSKAGWQGYNPYGTAGEFAMATQVFKGKYNPLKWGEKALGALLTGAGDYPFYMKGVLDHIGEQAALKAINNGFKGADIKKMGKKYADEIINSALKMSDVTKQVLEQASEKGAEATFRNDNMFSTALGFIHDGLNVLMGFGKSEVKRGRINVPKYGLGDLVLFFTRTPGALLNVGLEHSPLGILKSLGYILEGLGKGLKPGGKVSINATKVAEHIVKAASGTLFLSGAGYYLTEKGAMTGRAPNDKEAAQFLQEQGMREYSVNYDAVIRWALNGFNDDSLLKNKEGDKWFTYDWLAPFSLNVGMGANASQDKLFKGITWNKLGDVAMAIPETFGAAINTIVGSDTVSGLLRPTQGYTPEQLNKSFVSLATNSLTRFIPFGSLLNQVKQMTDNTARNTASDDPVQKAINLIKNRIPGLSKTLPAIITSTGKVKELYQGGTNNPLNVILNPAFVSKYVETPGSKLIIDLYKSTGKVTQFPRLKSAITIYGQPQVLSNEQKADLQQYIGMMTMNALDTLPTATVKLNKKGIKFNDLTDEQKLKCIGDILTQVNASAEEYMAGKLNIKKPTKTETEKLQKENATPKLKITGGK
jgi:histone H3/H4